MRLTAVRFAILSSALAMAAGFAQAQEVGILAPRQHRPVSIRRVHDDQTAVDSTNWSGYAVTGPASSVTYAAGSWVVPASTCPVAGSHQRATPSMLRSGSGSMDGLRTVWSRLARTPTARTESHPITPGYEFYPEPSYYATCSPQQERLGQCTGSGNLTNLNVGDVISASVTYNAGNNSFTLTLTDETSGASFSTAIIPNRKTGTPQRSSAEWIAEAPSSNSGVLPLADFGVANFGQDPGYAGIVGTCFATVSGLGPYPIGSFGANVWSSTMVTNSDVVKATPSALTPDGSSFTVTWYSAGP